MVSDDFHVRKAMPTLADIDFDSFRVTGAARLGAGEDRDGPPGPHPDPHSAARGIKSRCRLGVAMSGRPGALVKSGGGGTPGRCLGPLPGSWGPLCTMQATCPDNWSRLSAARPAS